MNKPCFLVLIIMSLSFYLHAQPIPGSLLFAPAQTQSLKLSPDGSYVMGEYFTEAGLQLVLKDIKNGNSYDIFKVSSNADQLSNFKWVDNDTVLIDIRTGGSYRAFVDIDIKGKTFKSTVRTIKAKGSIVDTLEREDDQVLFSRIEGKFLKENVLYKVDTERLVNNQFEEAKLYGEPLDDAIYYVSEPRNKRILAITIDGDYALIWYREGEKGKWQKAGKIYLPKMDFVPVGLIDNQTIAVLSNVKSEYTALIEFNLASQSFGKILYQQHGSDLTDAELAKGGKTIEYVRYFENGRLVTRFFTKHDQKDKQRLQQSFAGKQWVIVDQTYDGNSQLVLVFAADDPGRYYLYEHNTNNAILLGKISEPLDNYTLAPSEALRVKTDDQTEIEALLTLPIEQSNGVLMVMPHGGPVGVREIDIFDPQVQYLSSRGFAVLRINFRGSSGFGKTFENSGRAQLGKDIERDITAVVEKVRAEHSFNQMCSIGTSYGGYSAMMLAMLHPNDYQCVISMFGVYDLPHLFNASNLELTPAAQKAISAVLGENNSQLRLVSPFYMAERLKAPLLLVAGYRDKVAWFEQSDRMRYRLRQLGKDFETLFYKGVGHGHDTYLGERHLYASISQFIQERLNLPLQTLKKSQKIQLEDALLLADGYEFGKMITKDRTKALAYYRKAAELGNARALFNVGSYYHRGLVVDKNMNQAADWYQKASDAGYADASFRLASMYEDGRLEASAPEQIVKLYQTAHKNGHENAFMEIAKAQCTGIGIVQDIASCVATLTDNKLIKKQSQIRRAEIVGEIFWQGHYSDAQITLLKAMLSKVLYQSSFSRQVEVSAKVNSWGYYDDSNKEYEHLATTKNIPINTTSRFGVMLDLSVNESYKSGEHAVFKVRWLKPEVKEGQVTGQSEVEEKLWYFALRKKTPNQLFIQLKHWRKIPGDWKLEVYTLNNEKLFEKRFITQFED